MAGLDRRSAARRLRRRDAALDERARPEPSRPAGTDLKPQIRHIVLLMMENHSFDNYLGCLGRGEGLPDRPPVNQAKDGRAVPAHPFSVTTQTADVPSQSWRSSHVQFGGGHNDGFVTTIEDLTPGADRTLGMGYWQEKDLPFYYGLARTFPLADRWFSSCLGPTFPNRRFLLAATANGLIDDAIAGIIDYPATGTIFDVLNRHGITWANYHHVPPGRLWRSQLGARGRRILTLAFGGFVPRIDYRIRGEIRCTANMYPLGLVRTIGHLRHIERFFSDAAARRLPAVSIVDPDFAHCSEENPQDIQLGESFAADVIDAVFGGEGWEHTLLLWFYDEHGGYYDHVVPPAAVEPDGVLPQSLVDGRGAWPWLARHLHLFPALRRQDHTSGRYDRFGFRVPAVVVSPYARPGHVSSTVYDHTSALRLIEEKWNLPPLTRRDAAAGSPWEMVDLDRPPAFGEPSPLPAPAVPHAWRRVGGLYPSLGRDQGRTSDQRKPTSGPTVQPP